MQSDISEISWAVVVILAILGGLLFRFGSKGFKSDKTGQKDSFGVSWSERFGILTLNGIFLLLAALIVTIIKLASA